MTDISAVTPTSKMAIPCGKTESALKKIKQTTNRSRTAKNCFSNEVDSISSNFLFLTRLIVFSVYAIHICTALCKRWFYFKALDRKCGMVWQWPHELRR